MITLPNITVKANQWTNVYRLMTAITGINIMPGVNSINLQVLDGDRLIYCISANEPTIHHGYRALAPLETFENVTDDPGLWVWAENNDVTINAYPINAPITGFNIIPELVSPPSILGAVRVGEPIEFIPSVFYHDDDSTIFQVVVVDGVEHAIDYVFTAADVGKSVYVKESCRFVGLFSSGTFVEVGTSTTVKVLKAFV